MPWVWAALMPHPPIILPEIGRGREAEAGATLSGIRQMVESLRKLPRPEVLLILSPHQSYAPGALYLNNAPRVHGTLAAFGSPDLGGTARVPLGELSMLAAYLAEAGLPVKAGPTPDISRDHGTQVPMIALQELWPDGHPALMVSCPIGLSPRQALALGKALRRYTVPGNWALLASGDLSHRLSPDAPAGYNAEGAIFDAAVVEALKTGDPGILLDLSPRTLEGAGECGLRSVLTLLGLAGVPLEVFSYEGPFGVGYCTALWNGERANPVHPYPALARLAVTRHLRGVPELDEKELLALNPDASLWNPHKACFVSIKTREGVLRGCIGTILPLAADLGREIVMNAVSAAARDPRFPPLRPEELANVRFSVDVLSRPEQTDIAHLDPKHYGVIITKDERRGLLLPDLDGVDTVEQQVSIAAHKAGIQDISGARFQRFTVTRYPED